MSPLLLPGLTVVVRRSEINTHTPFTMSIEIIMYQAHLATILLYILYFIYYIYVLEKYISGAIVDFRDAALDQPSRLQMCHGGLPWPAACVAMMCKWPRLYWMSSVLNEHRVPQEIIDFGNFDGFDSLMWATDFPALSFEEKMPTGDNAHFQGEAAEFYAWKTAQRIFFD